MAIPVTTLADAVVTPTAFAAPTVSEAIASAGPGVYLWVKVGATATTVTVVRPGNNKLGDAVADYTTGALTSQERIIPITRDLKDTATGLVTVTFSQVASVTACLIRVTV
jgi:hypothetical protein